MTERKFSDTRGIKLKKHKYSEEQIREILTTAYPNKTEEEIDAMVRETLAQYIAEENNRGRDPEKKYKKTPS